MVSFVRGAGVSAQLMAKENGYAQIKLPSGEVRLVRLDCKATIGVVGNQEHSNISIGKAGRKRHMGWRPTVRGVVMNPNDHPHGGGEGKSPIGRPWLLLLRGVSLLWVLRLESIRTELTSSLLREETTNNDNDRKLRNSKLGRSLKKGHFVEELSYGKNRCYE